MANMILEDLTGNIGATAFPKIWDQFSIHLTANEPLLLSCRVTQQDAGETESIHELFIQDVSSLKHIAEKSIGQCSIKVKADASWIKKTRELLNKYTGHETKLKMIVLCNDGTEIPLSTNISIRAADMFLKEYNGMKDGTS